MRKVIAYIATSLDGKIADVNGGVEWLDTIPNPDQLDYGYSEFIKSIDTTLMGNTTYQQVIGFDVPFPYTDTTNYVTTTNKDLMDNEHVQFISENVVEFLRELKQKDGKDIWCIGGGKLISLLIDHQLLDEIQQFVMPIVLGDGIPLTGKLQDICKLKLDKTITHPFGVLELRYSLG